METIVANQGSRRAPVRRARGPAGREARRGPTMVTSTLLVVLALGAAACAPRQSRALEEARRDYMAAKSDPAVARYAALPLQEAGVTIDRAEQEQRRGNASEVGHLSYVARQEVAKARQIATESQARAEASALSAARDDVVVAARAQRVDAILAELAALEARETAEGLALTMRDVFFETDSAELTPAARRDLARLATYVREHPDRNVVIEGHTDSQGSDAYNDELSLRRAESVRSYLAQQGVDAARLVAQGYGERHPIASNGSADGRQQNRRVEMLVMNPGRVVTIGPTPIIVR